MTEPFRSAADPLLAAPSDGEELTVVTVSPGLPGFIAMFLLAAAVVLLAVDMTRRIRRLQARERVAERHRLEEERAAAEEADQEDADQADADAPAEGSAPQAPEAEGPAPQAPEDEGPGPQRP